jgi:hypothetical protein
MIVADRCVHTLSNSHLNTEGTMSQDESRSPDHGAPVLSRRETLKLVAAAVALAGSLGIPIPAAAAEPTGTRAALQLKLYHTRRGGDDSRLLRGMEIPEEEVQMMSREPEAFQYKLYRTEGREGELLASLRHSDMLQWKYKI